MLQMSDEEVWFWYEKIQDYEKQSLSKSQYCKANGLQYSKFYLTYKRIEYLSKIDPEEYLKRIGMVRDYQKSSSSVEVFAKEINVSKYQIIETITHLSYLDAIERVKKERKQSGMRFISMPKIPSKTPVVNQEFNEPQPELMSKQNDIELIISKGVKVIVSPEVGADKLIRIIELLKDL